MQYGVQLYTLRSLPVAERIRTVAEAGFDGIELVGTDPVDCGGADDVSVLGAHVDVVEIDTAPVATVEHCRARGTETLIVPDLDETFFSDDSIEWTAAQLDRVATVVADAGGRLLYHNHEFEFETDPNGQDTTDAAGTPFARLIDATERIGFEFDVGWATAAGVDPVAVIKRYGSRIPYIHLKDVRIDTAASRGGYPVDLGAGDVDLRGCLRAARAVGVEWLVFEHDAPSEPVRSVQDAAAWLRSEPSGPR